MRVNDTEIKNPQLCAGDNIEITADVETQRVIIHAKTLNQTRLKHGAFTVAGDSVEIVAGRNIVITTTHPNKLIIGVNIDREIARIVELENRIATFEKAIEILLNEHK